MNLHGIDMGRSAKINANIERKRKPKEPEVFEDRMYIINHCFLIHGSTLNEFKAQLKKVPCETLTAS